MSPHSDDHLLDREAIMAALRDLGARLHAQGLTTDIHVVGGAAIALTLPHRRTTADVDALVDDRTEEFARAAAQTGQALGLGPDWIGDDISEFISREPLGDKTLIALPGLNVYVSSPEHILAMKVRALAERGTVRDADDLVNLIEHLGIDDPEQVAAITQSQFAGVYSRSIGLDEYRAVAAEAFLAVDQRAGKDPWARQLAALENQSDSVLGGQTVDDYRDDGYNNDYDF